MGVSLSPVIIVNAVYEILIARDTETFKLFIKNVQCQHIIYGCRHDQDSLSILLPYKQNVLDASRIFLLGPVQSGSQLTFDALNLIAALVFESPRVNVSSTSDDDASSTALDCWSNSSSIEHQTPVTNRSFITRRSSDLNSPIYRFSDRIGHHSDSAIGHDSSAARDSFPKLSLATQRVR